MHLIVVHLNIARQVRAPALIHTDLFSQLRSFHLELAISVSDVAQLCLLFFDKSVSRFNLLRHGRLITLHGALEVIAAARIHFQLGILFPELV